MRYRIGKARKKVNIMIEINDKFVALQGKIFSEWEVIDILTTTNSKGEVVKVRYLCKKTYLAQYLTDEFCQVTVAMGKEGGERYAKYLKQKNLSKLG